jgi:hypothetical protein
MYHLRTRWQYCVGIAFTVVFSVAACAQNHSDPKMTEYGYPAAAPASSTVGGDQKNQDQVNALSRFNPSTYLTQLTGDYRAGTSPFLSA